MAGDANTLEEKGFYYGSYRGIVGKNNDPENMGRLQVICPSVYGDAVFEEWAFPKGIYAGNGVGSFFIPAEGDMIWVSFEGGDPRFPIWEYGWWTKGALMAGASPEVKILQTNTGHKIVMDDKDKKIQIKDANGNTVELNSNGISLVLASNKKISLGSLNGSAEPAVLGDTAMDLLAEFVEDMGNIGAIPVAMGVTSVISSSPTWAAFLTKWKLKWREFKSKTVSLDK